MPLQIALSDPYFIERKLYPNVDFYSGLIYKTMGFPTDFFPVESNCDSLGQVISRESLCVQVLFMIPRCSGWLSHWQELSDDKELKIIRPRQHYLGHMAASYVPMSERKAADVNISASRSSASIRGSGGRDTVAI